MHFDLRGGNGQTASDQGQNSDNFRFGRDVAFNIEQEINNQNTNNPMDYLQAANGYYQDKAYQGMVSIVV
jgi:hypothetical protein